MITMESLLKDPSTGQCDRKNLFTKCMLESPKCLFSIHEEHSTSLQRTKWPGPNMSFDQRFQCITHSIIIVERDSETSSIHLEDANSEPTDEYSSSSQSDENDEENEDQEENDMIDSEGEHTDYCCACKDVGQLLCCDRCPLAYHLECAFPPLKKIPEGEWLCQKCIVSNSRLIMTDWVFIYIIGRGIAW